MRGSILVTFDELINDRGIDFFSFFVNGVIRDRHDTDSNNLYSTYCFVGDVIRFQVVDFFETSVNINIIRRDYTTDAEGMDYGIKETIITPTIISPGPLTTTVEFTGSTIPSAYNFHYIIECSTIPTPSPTPTPTPTPSITPTPTPSPTPSPTPTPPVTIDSTFLAPQITTWDINVLNSTEILFGNENSSNKAMLTDYSGTVLRRVPSDPFQFSPIDNKITSIERAYDNTYRVGGNWTQWSNPFGSYVYPNKTAVINSGMTYTSTWLERGNNVFKIRRNRPGTGYLVGEQGAFYGDYGSGYSITGTTYDFAEQTDDKIIRVGNFTNGIQRLTTGFTNDATFTPGAFSNAVVAGVAIQSDGKIIAVGPFTTYSGVTVNGIVRLNTDGTIDNSFNMGTGFGGMYIASIDWMKVVIQSDGKIIVGGYFTSYDGYSSSGLVRINTDGSYDNTFLVGSGFVSTNPIYSGVRRIDLDTNEDILVGGVFISYNGTSRYGLIRLNNV